MTPLFSRLLLAIGSAVLLAGAIYSALWVVSSSSLAFSACEGRFSLFADTFQCRQPYIAAILALAMFSTAVFGMYLRARIGRSAHSSRITRP